MKIKIYSFIGPIGGGKTYRANELKKQLQQQNVPIVEADFSDPIREAVAMLYDIPVPLTDSKSYADWKVRKQRTLAPSDDSPIVAVSGRKILQRIGDTFKRFGGEDVFAKIIEKRVVYNVIDIAKERRDVIHIIVSSLRYFREAVMLLHLSNEFKQLFPDCEIGYEITFCNHDGWKYMSYAVTYSDHDSERLVCKLLKYGCKDGDEIATFLFKTIIG